MWVKNGDENPEETLTEGFSGNRRKNIQKNAISGGKDTVGKVSP